MRAVVVLLLLIANAIVASRNSNPADSAPPVRTDSSSGLLATVDGAAPSAPNDNTSCSRRPMGDAAPRIASSFAACASHSEAATAAAGAARL